MPLREHPTRGARSVPDYTPPRHTASVEQPPEPADLAEDIDGARLTGEAERLRSALLASISHDLRTPLASILGSATSLRASRQDLDDAAQDELLGLIQDEAERLNRFIACLLDMTRLDAGALRPRLDLVDLDDIIG